MINAGYSWSAAGENIVQGPTTAADAVEIWMGSAPHCANMMADEFVDLGVGYYQPEGFWTQVFGAPN